jgi:drug/metabolite transporter superfamily protein YnfA
MGRTAIILTLLFAAVLEAGGDAVIRTGMHAHETWRRALLFGAATIILFLYGWTVNSPPWDFGRLLGLYVVFFFVIAQLISWLVFRETPSATVLAGGTLIIAGGIVISLAKA